MSTVYIVTSGCYSDYHICAVSLEKERAKILAERYSDRFDQAEVEEFELDEFFEEASRGYLWFSCQCTIENGMFGFVRVYQCDGYPTVEDVGKVFRLRFCSDLVVNVLAENDEHARKIAAEKFATYIYEHGEELSQCSSSN